MHWPDLLDRFDLDDDKALHEQVDAVALVEIDPLVDQGEGSMTVTGGAACRWVMVASTGPPRAR